MEFQWLGLHAFTAGGMGLISGPGTKVPHAAWQGKKKEREKKKKSCCFLKHANPPRGTVTPSL